MKIWLKLLFVLALFATLMPIFSGYLVGFALMLTLLATATLSRLRPAPLAVNPVETRFRENARWLFRPVHIGVGLYVVLQVASELLSYAFVDTGLSAKDVRRAIAHMLVKNALLWTVLSLGVQYAYRRGWRVAQALPYFVAWMIIYGVYCIAQRYTGINWAQGWTAVLGPNRFAYGVYRVSGLMGHPLTLGYNLALATLACTAFASYSRAAGARRDLRLWAVSGAASLFILLISGSRFPLGVVILAFLLCEVRRLGRFRWGLLGGALLLVGLLWLEGSIVGRFGELFTGTGSFAERFPRAVFWKVHWQMFTEHPWIGSGVAAADAVANLHYDALGHSGERYGAHNMTLQMLADSGLVGLAGLLALWGGIALAARRAAQIREHAPRLRGISMLLVTAVLAGLMQNNFRDSEFLYAFWLWLALSGAAAATHPGLAAPRR